MDKAFNDPMYKEARELIKSKHKIKLYVEDLVDYKTVFHHEHTVESHTKPSFEQIVDSLTELRVFCKYVNRIGMTITKVEVVE